MAEPRRKFDQQREDVAGLPVPLGVRPTLLAGREELLARLDSSLMGDGEPQVVALHGLGGAGKTSVAVEYAHRHLAEVRLAWQFPAEDREVLLAEFARAAAQLDAREVVDGRNPVALVHAMLSTFRAGWLVVFDDAPDYEAIQEFLPPVGRGRVLITSQSTTWPTGWAVEVPMLGIEVAAGFLMNRTGDPDERTAEDLAWELGGLPLSLEQAAAYIQATRITLAGYLSTFQDRRDELLAHGETAGHSADVATAVGMNLSRLSDEAPVAAGMLRLLACLAPEPVPLALLLANARVADELAPDVLATVGPLLGDQVAARDAFAALRRYSLVTPAGDGLILVHRLVQHVAVAQVPADVLRRWEQAAAALVDAAIPADTKRSEAWPVCALLLPHARAVLDLTSGGMWRIARYLGSSGSYSVARDLFRLIADAHWDDDAFGPEHRDTLAACSSLARWTGKAGDAAGARAQYAALLPTRERILGPEHPQTLTTRANLARWTGEAGDAAGARAQFAALLPIMERVLGGEHPATLTSRASLAVWMGEAGNAAGARDQYAALLPIRERILGPEHPDTLTTRAGLAVWMGEAGNAAGARDQYAALLPICERVLGPEHPDTLTARSNLAYYTGQAGDAAAARDQFAALLPIQQRILGPEHPDTLTTRADLAFSTGEAGDTAGARDRYAALLPIQEWVLGAEHPNTLDTRASLAASMGDAGDAAGARGQFTLVLPLRARVLGPEHPDTLTTRADLAYYTGEAGDAAGARDQYAALLPIRERVLGPEHTDTLTTRSNLAYYTGQAGDAATARDQFAALLPVEERVLGAKHPDTLTTRANLAVWTGQAGDAAGARDQFAALLPIRERVLGPEHADTLTTRSNLAYYIGQAGDAATARDQFAALLPVEERVLGAKHPDTLTTRANLARWTGQSGD